MNVNYTFYRKYGEKVYIKNPELQELSFTKKLWSDNDSMTDVGRIIDFPEYQWENFYKKSINPTDGRNFYCLVYTRDDIPVGEASFHGYDSATKTARLNVRIQYKFRGNGYGKEAVRLILEYFFQEFGGAFLVEKIGNNIEKSILEKEGFKFINQSKQESIYRLSKEEFLKRRVVINRVVGIIVSNGFDSISLSYALRLFNEINKLIGEEAFTMKILGTKKVVIDGSGLMSIQVDELIEENSERVDIVLIPGNHNVNSLKKDSIIKFIKDCTNVCEMIIACEEGVVPLALSEELCGLEVSVPNNSNEEIKYLLKDSIIVDSGIIDNGKIILLNRIENILYGYLYVMKRLCGDVIYKELLEYLSIEN